MRPMPGSRTHSCSPSERIRCPAYRTSSSPNRFTLTSAGNVVNSFDSLVILDDGFGLAELYNGASATGSMAFLIPDGETALIRVRPGMLADEVFVQP